MDRNKAIETAYKNPEHGLGSAEKLYKYLKQQGHTITRKEIADWLSKQEGYQIMKPRNRKYYSFVAEEPNYQYQIDLIYMPKSWFNSGYKYIFSCVDVFTKKGAMVPMKQRDAATSAATFKKVLEDMGDVPTTVYSDQGAEFKNSEFKKVLKDNNITIIWALEHAPFVESFNKTMKAKLYKYMLYNQTKQWFKVLPILVKAYNNTEHTSTLFKPNDVNNSNKDQVRYNMYKRAKLKVYEEIRAGDSVRIPVIHKVIKGYKQQWSYEIHKVQEVIGRALYRVNDEIYPRKELQRVDAAEIEGRQPTGVDTRKQAAENRAEKVGKAKESRLLKEIVDEISNREVDKMIRAKGVQLRPRKKTR